MLKEINIGARTSQKKILSLCKERGKIKKIIRKWCLKVIVKCLKSGGRGRRKKSTEQGTDLAKTQKGCPGTVVTDMTVCGSGLSQSPRSLLWADLCYCSFHIVVQHVRLLYTLNINLQYVMDRIHILVILMKIASI